MKKSLLEKIKKMSLPERRRLYAKKKFPDLWEEYPVDAATFIDSPYYLNAKKETWPAIKEDVIELFSKDKNGKDKYDEAYFCEAGGGGKSHKAAIISAYVAYLVLCLKDPHQHLGLAKGDIIAIINMSTTGDQAKKIVYKKTKARIDNSPWFQKYAPPDPDIKSELRFPKDVLIFPGNSRNETSLGYSIICAIMDECAYYKTDEFSDRADEIYGQLKEQGDSRFNKPDLLVTMKIVCISKPRYKNDFIARKIREAKINPRALSRRRPIWKARPAHTWQGPTFKLDGEDIPIELEPDFTNNPERAWRIYGGKPSLTLEPYFREFDRIRACVDYQNKGPANKEGTIINKDFRGRASRKYNIHCDIGLSRDACGVCIGHRENNDLIVLDLLLQIKPKKGREIQLTPLEKYIIYFKEELDFNIYRASFDGFESAQIKQNLQTAGIHTERLSVDKTLTPYDTFKDWLYAGKVQMHYHGIFLAEMEHLELVAGKKVDHAPLFSKDVADAAAAVVYWCSLDMVWEEGMSAIVRNKNVSNDLGFKASSFHNDRGGEGGRVGTLYDTRNSNRVFERGSRKQVFKR